MATFMGATVPCNEPANKASQPTPRSLRSGRRQHGVQRGPGGRSSCHDRTAAHEVLRVDERASGSARGESTARAGAGASSGPGRAAGLCLRCGRRRKRADAHEREGRRALRSRSERHTQPRRSNAIWCARSPGAIPRSTLFRHRG
jgi:hypothetical protein